MDAYSLKEVEAPKPTGHIAFDILNDLEMYLSLRAQAAAIIAKNPRLHQFLGAMREGSYADAYEVAMTTLTDKY